jgi:hypothetical protein
LKPDREGSSGIASRRPLRAMAGDHGGEICRWGHC